MAGASTAGQSGVTRCDLTWLVIRLACRIDRHRVISRRHLDSSSPEPKQRKETSSPCFSPMAFSSCIRSGRVLCQQRSPSSHSLCSPPLSSTQSPSKAVWPLSALISVILFVSSRILFHSTPPFVSSPVLLTAIQPCERNLSKQMPKNGFSL